MVMDLMLEVERVRDAFHRAAFVVPDLDRVRAVAADDVTLSVRPTGTAAVGTAALVGLLERDVHPYVPGDLTEERVSRTVDRWRVAEEARVRFTHDRPLPWLLPGVVPDGRLVDALVVSVVSVARGRVTAYRSLWDLTVPHVR